MIDCSADAGKCAIALLLPPLLAACLLTGLADLLRAQTDVTGSWEITMKSSQGTGHASITLRQNAEKLTGVYKGRMGEAPRDGSIREGKIRFTVTLKFQNQPFSTTYSGTVENDSMKGTARFGDGGTGSWSARRKKD
jgi:hypothetical protein